MAAFFYFSECNAMQENDFYLNLEIRKSQTEKTDEYGNYYFEVEASNENVDLEDQVVLQSALMESKDEFLRGGVVSYDHQHKRKDENGNVVSDPSMIIGEPVDVTFDPETKSTIVTGKLYATNEKAREIIKMLKAGSTRVRASVGGIFPKIVKDVKTGVEKIIHVLWNDLALTVSPVNNAVGSATFAKSMTSTEFVDYIKKSLSAGYETDSNNMTGGRTLISEDISTQTINTSETHANAEKEIIKTAFILLKSGELKGEEAVLNYLIDSGIDKVKAGSIIREIITQGGQMMKKSFSEAVSALFKSLTGTKEDEDEVKKGTEENKEDPKKDDVAKVSGNTSDNEDEYDFGFEDDDLDGNDDENAENKEVKKSVNNGDEDEDYIDGFDVLKALNSEIQEMRKSLEDSRKELAKSRRENKELGEAIVGIAKMVHAIGSEELPPRSVFSKSLVGGDMQKSTPQQSGRPTQQDFEKVQDILIKSVKDGTIDIYKSSMISTDVQKCMATGKPMKQEYYEFLQKEFAKEAK